MNAFDWLWPLWIVAFAVIEGVALWRDKRHPMPEDHGFTLSAHLRRWFSVRTHLGRTVFIIVTAVFGGLFIVHIVTGNWF